MARHSVFPALHFAPLRLVAVCDLDAQRAQEAAWKFGARRSYTDYRQMWEEEDLEALIVHMHARPRQAIVLEALERGYPVFVPKSPALSLAQARELARASRRAQTPLMVNFQRRFSWAVGQAREILARPSFGRLSQLSLSFCSGPYDPPRSREYEDPVQAFLLDFAIHHLDLARWLGGEVHRVSVFHHRSGNDLAVAAALEFRSGAVGTLQANSQRIWWRNYDRIEITGQGEYLILEDLWSLRHYTQEGNYFTENYSDQRSGELTGDAGSLLEFACAVWENREPVASIHDTVKTMELYQLLYDAVREGRSGTLLPGGD